MEFYPKGEVLDGLAWHGLACRDTGWGAWALDASGAGSAVTPSRGERTRGHACSNWAHWGTVETVRWRALGTGLDGKLGQTSARDDTLLRAVHADAQRLGQQR